MAELRLWRRRHAPDIVAEVEPVPGMGMWDVSTRREDGNEVSVAGGRFGFLTDAHSAADTLTATAFGHRCNSHCSQWEAVERRRLGKARPDREPKA